MDTFNPNQMPPIQSQIDNKKSYGPLIAVILILAIIIIGSLYFLNERASQPSYAPIEAQQNDDITATLQLQGKSDDLSSIEADLNATEVDNLDQGAAVIQTELQ